MAILIPNMEMPKSCNECLMSISAEACVVTGDIIPHFWERLDRPSWCPLIELQPHGRLIDADALAGRLGITDMDCYKCAWGNHGFCSRGGDFTDACEAIEDAPTIIESEAEDGEV